jgi:hypothetical protein
MRTSYTTLNVPKYFDAFSLLSHHLPWYQLKDEGFYTVWSDIPTYCRCCHAEGHVVWNYPKKLSSHVCRNCCANANIAA